MSEHPRERRRVRVRHATVLACMVGVCTVLAGVMPAAGSTSGTEKRFCKAMVDANLLFSTRAPDDESTPNEIKQFENKVDKVLDRIEQNAPGRIADTAAVAADGVRQDPSLSDPAIAEAVSTLDEWVRDNCGYQVVDVTARDFAFEGFPKTLKTGIVLFDFTNEGDELHEMVLFRIKSKTPLEELLELPEEQADKQLEFVSASSLQQGESAVAYAQFQKPGRYAAVCFLPVGSTSPDAVETAEGPPHAAEGMVAEFKVKTAS